jgi:hypothetical protein
VEELDVQANPTGRTIEGIDNVIVNNVSRIGVVYQQPGQQDHPSIQLRALL